MNARGSARCGRLATFVGRLVQGVTGWRTEGEVPDGSHFVILAAPHTSNWDLVHMLAGCWSVGIRLSWMGKHTLFRPPFGALMRAMGGVPIDRRAPGGVVQQMVEHFARVDEIGLAVPPSGTRSHTQRWKSGFYHIARATGAPICASWLDYRRKLAGIGPLIHATGDVSADMDRIRAVYADITPRHPEKRTPVRIREEESAAPPDITAARD